MEDIRMRPALLGRERRLAVWGLFGSAGLFCLSFGIRFAGRVRDLPGTEQLLLSTVAIGFVLSSVSAYRNSGIVTSCLLVVAPLAGRLSYYTFLTQNRYVAMPGSFSGSGAAAFWLPVGFLLGSVGFCIGVAVRWAVDSPAATESRVRRE